MPDVAPEPTHATPDELAAIYLRARDVPCPGCGYNRRDGVAAACPECSAPLYFMSQQRLLRTKHRVWAAVLTIMFVASSSAMSGYFIVTSFTESYNSVFMRRTTFAVLSISVGMNLLALRALFALRREHPSQPGLPLFRLLIAITIAGTLPTMLLNALIYLPYW